MYELREIEERKKNKFTVTIVADENDGDYKTTILSYPKEVFDKHVDEELTLLLLNCWGSHNLENACNFEFNYLDLPYCEYSDSGICHTLESVNVTYIDEEGVTWEVDLTF